MNLPHAFTRLVRRVLLTLCGLFAFLALLGSQARPVSAASPSFIRLINASRDVGTVDVFVDGARFLGNARFASVTDYLQLPSGPHRVELALVGKGVGAAVIVQTLSVQAGAAYTVAAIGTKSTGFSLEVFVDDNLMASGMAKVRFYDLSPQSGSLSVTAGANTFIGPVFYRQASTYRRLAAGLYTFTVISSQPSFTLVDQVTLKTNTVTSLFLVGVLHGTPPLQVVQAQVKGLPSLSGTGSDPNTLPLNASQFIPLAALPLGVLALAGISAGWLTRFWPFSRPKGSGRTLRLVGSLLAAIVALALSMGGLSLASVTIHPAPAPSTHLLIPVIGVNAPIESVGVRANGTMETPRQSPWTDVGLYNAGPRPGERGSAVIAGHLDRPGGNPAVFWRLRELHVGDEVQVVDTQGKTLHFHVTRIASYPPQQAPVQDIFGNTAGSFLNLTTCAGDWIPTQRQTTLRLVVFTSFVGQTSANTSTGTSSAPPSLLPSGSNSASSSASPSPGSNSTSPSASSSPTPNPTSPSPTPIPTTPTVTITLPSVSPSSLSYTLTSLSGSATQLLNLSSGSQAESWAVQTGGLSWLSLDVTSGTLSAGQTQVLHVTVNPTALLPGTYTASITINLSSGGPLTVPVTLTVLS